MKVFFLNQKSKHRGFTLVEMLVVVALCTILTLALTNSIVSFYRLNSYTIAQSYQVDFARRGIDVMVRDLREMTYADNGTFPLATTSAYKIGFFSDIDRDNSVEYVEYNLSSTTLYKFIYNATGSPPTYSTSTPQSTTTLSEYVQNKIQNIPIFVYYTDKGLPATATTTATDLRYVKVSVIVNIDPVRDPGQFELRSSAALRNLIK